jgi:serine protease
MIVSRFVVRRPARRLNSMRRIAPALVAVTAVCAAPAFADPSAPPDLELREVPYAQSGWTQAAVEEAATDGLLVDFRDDLSDDDIAAIERETGLDLDDTTTVADGNLWLFRGSVADIQRAVTILKGRRDVETVEPNVSYALFDQDLEQPAPDDDADPAKPGPGKPNDPLYKHQWHMDMINMEDAWTRTQGSGVIVAVLDTGVSPGVLKGGKNSKWKRVPDLKETEFVDGWNFVNDSADPSDGHGHGTHVAGTIAQSTNNKFGVVGIASRRRSCPSRCSATAAAAASPASRTAFASRPITARRSSTCRSVAACTRARSRRP